MALIQKILTEVDNEIYISPEAREIAAFKKIWTRDRTDKYKKKAKSDLSYIYFMYDYRSVFNNYGEDEKIAKVKESLSYPVDEDNDPDLKKACDLYKELNETPSMKVLDELKESLILRRKIIRTTRKKLTAIIESLENEDKSNVEELEEKLADLESEDPEGEDPENAEEIKQLKKEIKEERKNAGSNIEEAYKLINKIDESAKSLNTLMDEMKKIENKVKEETKQESQVWGGGEINPLEE